MTAAHLTQSWQTIPHVLQAVEVDFHNVSRVRGAHKGRFKNDHGVSLTYLAFIARAVCIAIGEFPNVNARYEGKNLVVYPHVHLGIAVDLAHQGLLVPVIKNADGLTVAGLAKAIGDLGARARTNKILPDELSGGTYSLSNSGTFGTLITAPIVNPPEVAILSTDGVQKKPVVIESDAGDTIAIHPVGVLAQSFDHRAFDGAYSAAFLARVRQELETRDWARELE
jgi:2-oxoglutarate dehydrogenase E2 component (dihydrolipoamide succinyltransferase)